MRRAFFALAAATYLGMCVLVSLAHAAALDAGDAVAASRAAIGSRPGPHAFTDSTGRRATLAGFRGKPLVVSFVYTGCSQVCPTTTRHLAKAVREARGVLGDGAFHVASIGFDIPADNPVSMRVFARTHGVGGEGWSMLTPDPGVPEARARDLGFSYRSASGGFEHLTQVTILDAEGRVHTQILADEFTVPMLVAPLRALALGEPAQPTFSAALERVRLLCTVYDPVTGRYRLDYALFAELAAGALALGLTLGYLLRERHRARRA